jgi:hypothetical protein
VSKVEEYKAEVEGDTREETRELDIRYTSMMVSTIIVMTLPVKSIVTCDLTYKT